MSAAPNRYHQDISGNIEFILRKYLEIHPVGKLYDAPFDVYLTDYDVFQPDIVFIANDRFSILTREGVQGAPTLVIEILSRSTAQLDRSAKKKVYASTGVEEMWLVDPNEKSIAIFRLQENVDAPMALIKEAEHLSSIVFPGLIIGAGEVFKA